VNTKTRTLVVRGLGIIRIVVGLSTFVRPQLARRSLGVGTAGDADGGTVARMFGIRDAALAVATLSADPTVQYTGLRLGVLADIADTAAVIAGRKSGVTAGGAALIGGAAAFFAVVGMAVLPRQRDSRVP
jgi:hypothetical protein